MSSQEDEGGLKSMRYYPLKASYGAHFDTEDVSDFHDNPTDTGGPFEEEALPSRKHIIKLGNFTSGQHSICAGTRTPREQNTDVHYTFQQVVPVDAAFVSSATRQRR